MRWQNVLVGFLISLAAAQARGGEPTVYRIELPGGQTIWSEDKPQETASALLFHRYPGGVLMSVRRSDVRRVVAVGLRTPTTRVLKPGAEIKIGATGGHHDAAPAASTRPAARSGPLAPGEAKGGTGLFNPDRPYKPDWDTKLVPGSTMPYPNSPNDYREGKTLAYPPAPAVQTAPGAPPTMPQGTGEVPHRPQ